MYRLKIIHIYCFSLNQILNINGLDFGSQFFSNKFNRCYCKYFDMDDEKWEGEATENTPFLDSLSPVQIENEPLTAKKIGNRFFGIFVSITVGVYSGLVSRTMQEAWIYASLFCGEALICACISGIVKSYSFKKSITSFALYFLTSSISTPISCYLGYRFL